MLNTEITAVSTTMFWVVCIEGLALLVSIVLVGRLARQTVPIAFTSTPYEEQLPPTPLLVDGLTLCAVGVLVSILPAYALSLLMLVFVREVIR